MTALPVKEYAKGRYTSSVFEDGYEVFEDGLSVAWFSSWQDAFLFIDMKDSGVMDSLCQWRYPFASSLRPHAS